MFFFNAHMCVNKRLSLSVNGWTDEKQRNERHNARFTFFSGGINECRRHKSALLCAIAMEGLCLTG